MSLRTSSGLLIAGGLSLVLALVWNAFARQPGLGTFADDSVSYLVMAQAFSPWRAAGAAVLGVLPLEGFHPPLFPMVLAFSGAAHDFALAHSLNAVLLAACLPLVYVVALRWLGSVPAALLALLAVAVLPAHWIQVRGILSEPLFCLLLLAAIAALEARVSEQARAGMLAFLLAALALTRTVGLAVAMAYALWALSRPGPLGERVKRAVPALGAFASYALWLLVRPTGVPDANAGAAADRLAELLAAPSPWSALAAGLARQALAMAEAWTGSLMLFWVEGSIARPTLAAAIGVLALVGLCIRYRKADAWMVGAYLGVYLVWPFYDQMTRFLFPVVPALVVYAFVPAIRLAAGWRRPVLPALVLALTVASLALPALGFIQQRARSDLPHARIIDWYRTPDLAAARTRAQVQLDLLADMQAIRAATGSDSRVMWVAPAYIALLAGRTGVPAPSSRLAADEYRRAVDASGADFVYLSTYHPRDTIREEAWRAGTAALAGQGHVVWQRERAAADGLASTLIRLRR
jgi:hypothetical protein